MSPPECSLSPECSPERSDLDNNNNRRFWDLRGVYWRTGLGVLPFNSSVEHVRRVAANSRRSYAAIRRSLLIDPVIPKDGSNVPDLVIDNPLSQDPDSNWGRFFQKAEIEKMVDQDLSRLYPEHDSYFQTPRCPGVLRRILLLWCIRHPNFGYRQGMHELLAPLVYVLQADIERLSAVRKLYEHYFTDNFDGDIEIQENQLKFSNLDELDPKIQTIISFSDAYGAEGELGVVLSEKFMEHDAYCMFDALMSGSGGAVSMANFFSPSPGPQNGLPPVIEASSELYHLLAMVDSSLYAHFIELGVEPQYFALRWLRVLFRREFALEDLLVIWDEIFSFDNNRLNSVPENDPEASFGALGSRRGAFIAAFSVSMILYIRSSILATETATSCLQRLLNFPQDVNLGELLKKANSLLTLAIDAVKSVPPQMDINDVIIPSKLTVFRSHSLSFDAAAASRSPVSVVRESYWEEKWRNLHKEQTETNSQHRSQSQRKGWSEKVKSRLLRTESDPKAGSSRPHVRRSLLNDLARELGFEEETEELESGNGNGGSEENSSIFSDLTSPTGSSRNANDHENDTEQSSEASNLLVDENNPEFEHEPELESEPVSDENGPEPVSDVSDPERISDVPEDTDLKVVESKDSVGKSGTNLKDRILLSGKFQWFWKFGKNADEGSVTTNSSVVAASETDVISEKESVNQTNDCMLKNLGKSMEKNLQVIESVLLQEKGEIAHVDNLSNKALVDRGQTTAMAALKELRKISNILSEM